VQHFWHSRLHPGPLARSQDDRQQFGHDAPLADDSGLVYGSKLLENR
jgi:hypothetical protein